jgi:hypothetical protein
MKTQMNMVAIIRGLVMKSFRVGDEVTAADFPLLLEVIGEGEIRITWTDTGEVETWSRQLDGPETDKEGITIAFSEIRGILSV